MRLFLLIFLFIVIQFFTTPIFALADPRSLPNNIFGINLLSPESEIEEASSLLNSGGDWGWIVITIRKDEQNLDRWQSVLNKAAKNHLIPIIRLATVFDNNGYWQRPELQDAQKWADFLSKLYYPTKNRYIQIYNEVNRASEWGGNVDGGQYALELNNTIDALKSKSPDFFVLNSPLDLALVDSNSSQGALTFFENMENSVPGIFSKLDGWASHSYPNPDFSAVPNKLGKTGIRGFAWELEQIEKYSQNKDLPVFITETGWRRSTNGVNGLHEDQISKYYIEAFTKIWTDKRIVVVAPFIFDYPEPLYHEFSFKTNGEGFEKKYYNYFFTIRDLPKVKGKPQRQDYLSNLQIEKSEYSFENIKSKVSIKFKNTGNYIWDTNGDLKIDLFGENVDIEEILWNKQEIYPGEEAEAKIVVKTRIQGVIPLSFEIKHAETTLIQSDLQVVSVSPVSFVLQKLSDLL